MVGYTDKYTPEQLEAEANRILNKFPDRIPIIVEKDPNSDIEEIDKNKYLVPANIQWSTFVQVIRKRLQLNSEKGLFIFVGNIMLNSAEMTVGQIYQEHRDKSGFLKILYSGENVFGTMLL